MINLVRKNNPGFFASVASEKHVLLSCNAYNIATQSEYSDNSHPQTDHETTTKPLKLNNKQRLKMEFMAKKTIKVLFKGKTTTITVDRYTYSCTKQYLNVNYPSKTVTGFLNEILAETDTISFHEQSNIGLSEIVTFQLLRRLVNPAYDAAGGPDVL